MPEPKRDEHDEPYVNIRDILGPVVGKEVVAITQHDKDEYADTGDAYVELLFSNGFVVRFHVTDAGFDVESPDDADEASGHFDV